MTTKIEFYKAKDGIRWRIKRRGRIVAESGEAYTRERSARTALDTLINSFFLDDYEYVTGVEIPLEKE